MQARGPRRAFVRQLPPDDPEIRSAMEEARGAAKAAGKGGFAAAAAAGEAREALLRARAEAGIENPGSAGPIFIDGPEEAPPAPSRGGKGSSGKTSAKRSPTAAVQPAPAAQQPQATAEPGSEAGLPELQPEVDETFLTLDKKWLELILSGQKTLEIRSYRVESRQWFLGTGGYLYAVAKVGEPFVIEDDDAWVQLFEQHQVPGASRMYQKTKTWALPLTEVRRIAPVGYAPHPGAIGRCKFEPLVIGEGGRILNARKRPAAAPAARASGSIRKRPAGAPALLANRFLDLEISDGEGQEGEGECSAGDEVGSLADFIDDAPVGDAGPADLYADPAADEDPLQTRQRWRASQPAR